MLIAWDNKVDAAFLTVGSEISTLPGSNVQQPHLSRKWHTAAGVKNSYIVFDFGSSLSCSALAILGTNFTSAATLQLRASDADPGATGTLLYDSGAVAAGVVSGYGAAYKTFNPVAARYWRLDVADAALPDNLQVGRVFLGPSWTPSAGQLYDWGVTPDDPSPVAKSKGGQSYPEVLPKTRFIEFGLDFMNEAEMYGNAFAMARANGAVRDVLVIPNPSGAFLSHQAIWGLIKKLQALRNRITNIFTQKFTVEERL